MTDIAKILNYAADHMERVGLHKGNFFKDYRHIPESPCCALGALKYASGFNGALGRVEPARHGDYVDARRALHRAIGGAIGEGDCITRWNDDPEQTKRGVVEGLRKAAALHE